MSIDQKTAKELFKVAERVAQKGPMTWEGNIFYGVLDGQNYEIKRRISQDYDEINIKCPDLSVRLSCNMWNPDNEYDSYAYEGQIPDNFAEILNRLEPNQQKIAEFREKPRYAKSAAGGRNKMSGQIGEEPKEHYDPAEEFKRGVGGAMAGAVFGPIGMLFGAALAQKAYRRRTDY